MQRRGFLGFLFGAAASGPSVARAAWEADVATSAGVVSTVTSNDQLARIRRLAARAMRTPEQHAFYARRQWRGKGVDWCDPDIVAKRSWSGWTKLRAQRDRDYWASIRSNTSILDAIANGIIIGELDE